MDHTKPSEILAHLDFANQKNLFPVVQMEDYYNAGIKMKVFTSDSEWLVIFESLDFTERDYTFMNQIIAFGNQIGKEGVYEITDIINAIPEKPFFSEESFDIWLLDLFDFELQVKGQPRHFIINEEDYIKAGVDLKDEMVPKPVKTLRLLAHLIPDELFFPNDKLLEICGRNEAGLQLFLELEDWYHPDIIEEREGPSDNPCFRSLANAIAQRDANLYHCPKEMYNTHWSNWEWYREDCQ